MSREQFLREALLESAVVVCVGCGGVGKTTLAAALGLEAARRGRRVLVLTIDPARRLADALGLAALGNTPQSIPRSALAALGVPEVGTLSALMLDMKQTFDELVTRFSDSEETRARIFANPLYRHVSEALAGSIEYSAMEKVHEAWESRAYDLIVVDTPPAQHALDFLDAPQRLVDFLESRLVQVLIHPAFSAGRFGFRIFQQGTRRILQLIERVSGMSFLQDISEFLLVFEGMSAGFVQRAGDLRRLLRGPDTSFVLVAGPSEESMLQARQFLARLDERGIRLVGVLANRMHRWPGAGSAPRLDADPSELAALAEALRAASPAPADAQAAARATLEAACAYGRLVERDQAASEPLRAELAAQGRFFVRIPEQREAVSDLAGLDRIARDVFGPAPGEAGG